ncbi:MAG TPA: STAS domain-containing protein [Dermatophilaceae bacterium]
MALGVLPPSADPGRGVRSAEATAIVRAERTRTVLLLSGELDLFTRPVLSDALSKASASRAGDVVVDLADVTFIDTAIVRALALSQQLLNRQSRTLTFRSPSRIAALILHLFGLAGLIKCEQTAPVDVAL